MNQPSWATDAQSKIRRFGYWWQAWSSVSFQACMLVSDQGPDGSRVFTFTHITGAPFATDISSWIRAIRPTLEPADTFAVSLVPSATTQQPRNPWLTMVRAVS